MMQELALELIRQGHQVTVATPSVNIRDKFSISEEDGITVVRVKTGDLKGSHKAVRMWRESRLSKTMLESAQSYFQLFPCDLIVFYSPSIFFGHLVRRLKALWGCPSYLIVRDIFPKWAVDAGLLRKGLLYRYLKRKELEQYAAADIIGVEAPGDLAYFQEVSSGLKCKVEVLYNWLDARSTPRRASKWRERLGLAGKIVFFYGGNIGVAQDIDNLVRLADGLRDRAYIYFLLMGCGSEVRRLNAAIESKALQNIGIHPPIPQEDYMQCLSEFDVGLISLDRRLRSNNFTGKLLGYVLCGMPILASVRPGHDLINLLNRADAGIGCANGEDDRLRASALLLASDPEIRRRMGINARSLGDTIFSVRIIASQILSHYESKIDEAPIARQASIERVTACSPSYARKRTEDEQ
jgi:glycosyltransferase involved in cell wall biosynthesis